MGFWKRHTNECAKWENIVKDAYEAIRKNNEEYKTREPLKSESSPRPFTGDIENHEYVECYNCHKFFYHDLEEWESRISENNVWCGDCMGYSHSNQEEEDEKAFAKNEYYESVNSFLSCIESGLTFGGMNKKKFKDLYVSKETGCFKYFEDSWWNDWREEE